MIKKSLRVVAGVWAHLNGMTYFVPDKKSQRELTEIATHSGGLIPSPMPGKVFKLKCKTGDLVENQQILCIIEAMKMEYSVKAPFKGKVKTINKLEGQQVQLGETLMEIVAQ